MEGEKAVDDIFVALSECTSLHPCEDDSDLDHSDRCHSNHSDSESDTAEFDHNKPPRKINKLDEERFEDAAEK